MTFEFGETAESEGFFDRNPTFMASFERLVTLANRCFGREIKFKAHLEHVVFSLGHTCREDFLEVVFLAVNGYASAASKIFRGLYERGVTLAYIVENPEKAKRFYRFSAIQAHRAMEAALQTFTEEEFEKVVGQPNTVARIREWYKQVKPDFQTTLCKKCDTTRTQSTWDVDFGTMVQRVGEPYRKFFLNAYTMPTLQIHATMASAFDGRDREQKVSIENRHREADLALYSSACILIAVMKLQNKIFALGSNTELDGCEREMETWEARLQAAPPITLFEQSE